MKHFDQLFFVRLFFLAPLLALPFLSHPAPNNCQLCRHETAVRSKPFALRSSQTLHFFKLNSKK